MGISLFGNSSSSFDGGCVTPTQSALPNPDPYNWKILEHWQIGRFLVVKINYPNCVNYEGTKIMVYEGCNLETLKKQTTIDPHFSNNQRFFSPIARFVPTDKGLEMALAFVRMVAGGYQGKVK